MSGFSRNKIKVMIAKDIAKIYNQCDEVKNSINKGADSILDFLETLIAQIPNSSFGPLIAKTPKISRKREIQRIETIPEDVVFNGSVSSHSINKMIKLEEKDEDVVDTIPERSKREASKKAYNNIKKQQSSLGGSKLKRVSSIDYNDNQGNKKTHDNRSKRTKSSRSSSDEDEDKRPTKHSKIEETKSNKTSSKNMLETTNDIESQKQYIERDVLKSQDESISNFKFQQPNKKRSTPIQKYDDRKSDIIDETLCAPVLDSDEPSLYEDAIGKPTPIMNSTMKHNSGGTLEKMMNVTVTLEKLPKQAMLNETVTIKKSVNMDVNEQSMKENNTYKEIQLSGLQSSEIASYSKKDLQDRMQQLKDIMVNKEFNALLTDDESSPEMIKTIEKQNKKLTLNNKMYKNCIIKSTSSSSDDEVLNTPIKPILRDINTATAIHEMRNAYKTNALFSPYAKESVKKRVEAFEQAVINSPKQIEIDSQTRITRTKTRAMAAAEANKNITQKLVRKSLAKAKKISLAKQAKVIEESKENKIQANQKSNKLTSSGKTNQKQQTKTTPLGKVKIQLPLSVNRIQHTPSNNPILSNYTKALTASHSNIVTSVETFLQTSKGITKTHSTDKLEERKWKINEEDARRKRDEALRLQTEEKRKKRQEKELKNKLAREAKEKQNIEKRLKVEREKEEKAKLAQQLQEKQREEIEKKRLAQLQRAQEKEEKRRHEEQQRLQRLLEQEETERLLAEQRRKEQEAEKRRDIEARAQQQNTIEAMKLKTQMLVAQMKLKQTQAVKQGPTNYILDSEPDDDESDDESKPKHVIPFWAQSHIRKTQLAVQRYIPEKIIYTFFDTRKCTPDLTELFIGIDRSRLKRTSSAIWKTPPRCSLTFKCQI